MSQENPVLDLSFQSKVDLSGGIDPDHATTDFPAGTSDPRYRFVKVTSTAREIDASTSNADILAGVLKSRPLAGQFCDIAVMGTSKVRAAGAINANSFVKHDNATGKVVQGGAGADVNIGFALEAATADGDVIECIIFPLNKVTT